MVNSAFGIDIGTSTVKIYDQKNNRFIKEKNMIAIRNDTTVFAVGNDAYEMFEKTPEDIRVLSPMSNGRINDVLMMEAVLHILLTRTERFLGSRPAILFSVPVDMTELERRTYITIAGRGKLKRCSVRLAERPIAAAFGLGIPLHRTKGAMIVDIGAQCTDLSILSEQHVILNRQIPAGGMQFSEAIAADIRRKSNFQISNRTAERLKHSLCDLSGQRHEGRKVSGLDMRIGLPRDGVISSYTVTSVMKKELDIIIEEVKKTLERTPPQIRASIINDGLFLIGGSTEIPGIDTLFSEKLGCHVQLSPQYDLCTAAGLKILSTHRELQHWTYTPKKKSKTVLRPGRI